MTLFTVEQANRTLPLVRRIVEDIVREHRRWQEKILELELIASTAAREAGQTPREGQERRPPSAESPKPRAESPQPRAESQERGKPRAESREPRAEVPPDERVAAIERDAMAIARDIDAFERELEALGIALKDRRLGLIDFPGEIDGRRVWLCWRLGEPAIQYWHDLDAGYAGRQPLPAAALK